MLLFCFQTIARGNETLLDSIFTYKSRAMTMLSDSITINTSIEYHFNVNKRNFMLMFIPSMFEISRGKRNYEGCANYLSTIYKDGTMKSERLNYTADTFHGRRVMKVTDNLLFPNIYNRTFYKDLLLSPFHRSNQRFYRFRTARMANGLTEVVFIPRARNTQFLSGRAYVESKSGRILKIDVSGEYDMVKFISHIEMNDSALFSLTPKKMSTEITFNFVGNKIDANILGNMGQTNTVADTTTTSDTLVTLETTNPQTPNKKPLYKKLDFLILNLSSEFGKNDNVHLKMSPIINPLYVSYNHKRGITYRSKMRIDWGITDSLQLKLRANVGYSFKQRSFYYTIPLTFNIGTKHNIYIGTEVGKKIAYYDEIAYTDLYIDSKFNYDLTSTLGLQAGIMTHKRLEHSFAPYLQLIYRPMRYKDLCLTLDYERSFPKIFGANAKYEKYEASGSLSRTFDKVSKMTTKLSGGFYTSRSQGTYTLDYKNFNYNYLQDGWEDWGGNFQLLSSRLYNQSEWYVAGNLCYETPMLAFSYLPIVGRYTEEERIYSNILFAEKMHPYIECGYAFANRLFSVGFFLSTKNFKYDGLGVNFSFELFNKW